MFGMANSVRKLAHPTHCWSPRKPLAGINFWNAIRYEISYWFDRKLANIILDIASFNKVINKIEPDILVVGTDSATAIRGHVLLAKQRGIPVLEVQHGLYPLMRCMATPLSDKIAAGGDYSREV